MTEPGPEAAPPGGGRLRRSLALVGMMGVGKTSVGQALARRLGARFLDSDQEIAVASGMTIPEIFARFGEAYFRAGERRVIGRLLSGPPVLLATGGGAFVQPETRALIRAHAATLWLRADPALIWERLRGKAGRPLLDGPDPFATIAALDRERASAYAEADFAVDSLPAERHETAATRILALLEARDADCPPERRILEEMP